MPPVQRQGVPIGTNQAPWYNGLPKGTSGSALCTNTTAPGIADYAHIVPTAIGATAAGSGKADQGAAAPVAISLANGVFPIRVPELTNRLNFKFILAGGDNVTGAAFVFGLKRMGDGPATEWIGEYLGSLAITAGAKVVNTNSQILPSVMSNGGAVRWADTISPTEDSFNDSWEVFSDTAEGAAVASLDSFGYEVVVVVLDVGTAEAMGFIWNAV